MDDNLSLICFFEAKEQPESEINYMLNFTRDYLVRYDLFDAPEKYTQTTVDFARFCLAPRTSRLGLAASCMYIAWLLFLDDSPEDTSLVDTYKDIIQSNQKRKGNGPIGAVAELSRATHELARVSGLSPIEFGQRAAAMMQAQKLEYFRLNTEKYIDSEEEYLHHRPDVLGNGALLSLMKLDSGVDLEQFDPLARARARLLEELCHRLAYLSNDILSNHRDEHDFSEPTIVRVLANKFGLTWSEAVSKTITLHNREMKNYAHLRAELLKNSNQPNITRFVEIADADLAGNLAAMEVIASRYQITAQTPIFWQFN